MLIIPKKLLPLPLELSYRGYDYTLLIYLRAIINKLEMFIYKKLSLVAALLFLSVGLAMAQTTISGTVFSADDNEPLMGANILVEGTQNRAITDLDGKFTLNEVKSNAVLVVSMIGMRTEKVKAKDGMRIMLQSEDVQMTEVIVNGQQQIDKRLFTGAATTVDAEKIKLSGLADVSRSLEGRPRFASAVLRPSMVTLSPFGWWMASFTKTTLT